jgi:hypothetical protein
LAAQSDADLKNQVAELRSLVQKLQARVDQLEARTAPAPAPALAAAAPLVTPAQSTPAAAAPTDSTAGTTVNFTIDTYYGYNFNAPIGRFNQLRAYDVSSNAFSLNQAAVVLENAPDPAHGKRWGARLDLQFGQATNTLQGNPVNEPRPDIYRNVFQAYGTYVFPVGTGLTVDVGKWASSLGYENNYTKDQINYSRSYWFNYLPFYHMGARAAYKPKDWLTVNYWIVNGAQQTEDFNAHKDQLAGITAQNKTVNWTLNYYTGQEHAEGAGRLHILDTYASFQVKPKLLLGLEADYVIERLLHNSAPSRVTGGVAYARYQITPRLAIGARTEYLGDRGGLFSGATQSLKETTLTFEQKLGEGFEVKEEWRRDFSNRAYFLTDRLGILSRQQTTATVGLVWWFGPKQGAW